MSVVFDLKKKNPEWAIPLIISFLKKGKVVALPTETSYCLAVDATNRNAVRALYRIKKRDPTKPLSVFVGSVKDAQKIAVLDKHSLHLMRKFMPGPLTLVARAKGSIAKNVHGNGKIAFRISSNKFLQKLCKKYKNPITATSANLSGQPPIYAPKELTETFDKKVDAIANAGKLRMRKPSTIFDATAMKILREGPVSKRKIFLALSSR